MAQLTQFGKHVRKMRIDLDISLREMANGLGVSASYLSAVETGRRELTQSFAHRVAAFFEDRGCKTSELWDAADRSIDEINVSSLDEESRALVAAFARRSPEERQRVLPQWLASLKDSEEG